MSTGTVRPSVLPRLRSRADLLELERTPLADRGLGLTTYDMLVAAAERWPDHAAVVALADPARPDDAVTTTYADLLVRVHRVAHVLHELGVGRDDAVTLLSPNCTDLIVATLAAEAVGIASPINPTLEPEHLAHILRLTGSRVVLAAGPGLHAQLWERVVTAAPLLGVEVVVGLDGDGSGSAGAVHGVGVRAERLRDLVDALPADAGESLPVPAPGPDDVAAYFHTGGTTGAPKVAVHLHRHQAVMAWSISTCSGLAPGEAILAGLPLFHVNALMVTVLGPMVAGAHGVWPGPLGYRDPAIYPGFWRLVEAHRPVAMSAVPTVYAHLAQVPVDADISSLRMPVVGASPLPASVREAFRERTGLDLREGYGLTEATCASSSTPAEEARAGSVGLRMPYQQVAAVNVRDGRVEPCPDGAIGEIAIAGPTVFAGYLRRDGSGVTTSRDGVVVDGWLLTGDLGVVEDDWVFLRGRSKDLIIRGGHNIDPAVIEDALLTHPAVLAAGAVGQPDPAVGEVPVAYVQLAPDADPAISEADLVAYAASRVSEPAARPRRVTVLDALPVTAVGKPFKPALREDAALVACREHLAGLGVGVEDLALSARHRDGVLVVTVSQEHAAALAAFPFRVEPVVEPVVDTPVRHPEQQENP